MLLTAVWWVPSPKGSNDLKQSTVFYVLYPFPQRVLSIQKLRFWFKKYIHNYTTWSEIRDSTEDTHHYWKYRDLCEVRTGSPYLDSASLPYSATDFTLTIKNNSTYFEKVRLLYGFVLWFLLNLTEIRFHGLGWNFAEMNVYWIHLPFPNC